MNTFFTSRFSKRGFTLVELIVAISILTLLAVFALVSYATARTTGRDGRRKSDVQAIVTAVSQYSAANGTLFIQDSNPVTHQKKGCAFSSQTDPDILPSVADGCVGALGRSYGKVSLKSANNSTGLTGGAQPLTSGYGSASTYQFPGRTYSTISIADGLRTYLNSVPRDPSSDGKSFNDPTLRDYVLIRACRNGGRQAIGTNGSIFAVWTSLEGTPTAAQLSINSKLPGGSAATAPQSNGNPYQYDFAAQQSEFNADFYGGHGYAVGNGGSVTVSDAAGCDGVGPTTGNS